MLSNQFFAQVPQCRCGLAIKCVRANAFAVDTQWLVIRDNLAQVAVLAIACK
jgi:hypothetical protein